MTSSCVPSTVQAWLRQLADDCARGAVGLERLAAALGDAGPADLWLARARFDDAVPYGRTALVSEEGLELMIAGWSRGRPCAPHDHGPGQGAVRVLQGQARHRGFRLRAGVLSVEVDEELRAGDRLCCPRGFIHQVQDDGGPQPLVTLHLYVGPTVPMTVYDLAQRRTQWLGPGCGAWPRPTGDPAVLRWAPGLVPASAMPPARGSLMPC
jgi:hypothetical protein